MIMLLSKFFSRPIAAAALITIFAFQASAPKAPGDDYFRNLGVAGLVIYFVIRDMFAFLKSRRNGANGRPSSSAPLTCPLGATVELWEEKLTRAIVSGLKESLGGVLTQNTETLKTVIANQRTLIDFTIRQETRQKPKEH
jgi:hypothetical protein